MKWKRNISVFVLALIVIESLFVFSLVQASAHEAMLEISYDSCIDDEYGDGIDEVWYILDDGASCRHLSQDELTIKYYFKENSVDGTCTWTTIVSEETADEIKNAYAESMKKWNNVYFYSYDSAGNVVKNRLVNVIEGTELDHNLSIYPLAGALFVAATELLDDGSEIIESSEITHQHYSKWRMQINVRPFFVDWVMYYPDDVAAMREGTGAHELGHILGLRDVDVWCDADNARDHHHELLMGYGGPITETAIDITYKDIAGVAITRGFHTDADHRWLYCGELSDGTHKLLCSICNGVKTVDNLAEYTYDLYNACAGDHALENGNMMAVASYGTKDYYKCKYCRYVAPFSANVSQNYTITRYSTNLHKGVNNVSGLGYTFYEAHSYSYEWLSETRHACNCVCGRTTAAHVVLEGSSSGIGGIRFCLLCHGRVSMGVQNNYVGATPRTVNGSYILPNGIVVLVDEDINAYLSGTLVFSVGETE